MHILPYRTGYRLSRQLPRLIHQIRIDRLRRWIRSYALGKLLPLAIYRLIRICQGMKTKVEPRRFLVHSHVGLGRTGGRTSVASI
jgi:hypothetical protein